MLLLFRLVKAGYGDFKSVSDLNARVVLQALYYEKFCSDYERAYIEVNNDNS